MIFGDNFTSNQSEKFKENCKLIEKVFQSAALYTTQGEGKCYTFSRFFVDSSGILSDLSKKFGLKSSKTLHLQINRDIKSKFQVIRLILYRVILQKLCFYSSFKLCKHKGKYIDKNDIKIKKKYSVFQRLLVSPIKNIISKCK